MRGYALLQQQPPTKDNLDEALALFRQSLAADPNYASALAGTAYIYMAEYAYGWINPKIDYDAKIIVQADRAIALAPENGWAHYAKSMYLDLSQRANEAFGAADTGLAVNPNFALLYGARAVAETSLGHFEQAKSDLRQAMRLVRANRK